MKKLFSYIIIGIFLLGSLSSFAQYQNNGRRNGVDRRIPTTNSSVKKEPIDRVQLMTDNMTTKLKLDGFQSAIVKNTIEDYLKTINAITIEDIPNVAKGEKAKIAQDLMQVKFVEILNDKQKILFEELKNQENPKKKKDKKGKEIEEPNGFED
jgi:hypothetical protein